MVATDPHSKSPALPERINCARFFAPSIQLFAGDAGSTPQEVPQFKWIHCCNEGDYQGHHQGPFEMTRAVFDSFVRNLRDDPQYKAGTLQLANGKTYTGGVRPVIQFDYEHASEMPPWEGSIASSGAPAPAWVLDVEVRNDESGKAQLWAFAKLGDQIREQIARDEYRSVSIAFTLNGVHWITKEEIGPMLTSIAFTNHPFMRDLLPVAAASRGYGRDPKVQPSQPVEAPGLAATNNQQGNSMAEELRERVCKALGIRVLQDDAAVIEAVEEAASGNASLGAILSALGVENPDSAIQTIPQLQSARSQLASIMSELDALLAQDAAMDQEMATADVAAAMSAQRYQGEGAKRALFALRAQLVSEETSKLTKGSDEPATLSQRREARTAARKRFLSDFGISDPAKVALTRPVAAGPNGSQLSTASTPIPVGADAAETIDLTGYSGRNVTERLLAYCEKNEDGFKGLPVERKLSRVHELRSHLAA